MPFPDLVAPDGRRCATLEATLRAAAALVVGRGSCSPPPDVRGAAPISPSSRSLHGRRAAQIEAVEGELEPPRRWLTAVTLSEAWELG